MAIRDEIRNYVSESMARGASIKNNDSLFDSGVVDSLQIIEFVLYLEKQYGVRINASEVVRENFDTVDAIASLVESKKPA